MRGDRPSRDGAGLNYSCGRITSHADLYPIDAAKGCRYARIPRLLGMVPTRIPPGGLASVVLSACLGLVSGQGSTRVYLGRLRGIGCKEARLRKALQDKHLERLGA